MITEDNISYIPKYIQIQDYILQRIKNGIFLPGDRTPSKAEFSKQSDVSRVTVNTAIKELASAGVMERIQGKGTSILSPDKNGDKQPFAFAGETKIEPFEQPAHRPHKLLEHGIIQAGLVLHAKLNLDQGVYVYKTVRCVCQDGLPIGLDYNYILLSVRSNHTFDSEAPERISLHEYVRKYFNKKPTRLKIFINTQITRDMDISSFKLEKNAELLTWNNFAYRDTEVLAVTTIVCASQLNESLITLEF